MGLFKKKHVTEVYYVGTGWIFRCACGAQSRTVPERSEADMKARYHRETAARG